MNALLSGKILGPRFCSAERRLETFRFSLDRWQDGGRKREGMFLILLFLSIIEQIIRQIFVRICRLKQL